jgi:hypothetical protein
MPTLASRPCRLAGQTAVIRSAEVADLLREDGIAIHLDTRIERVGAGLDTAGADVDERGSVRVDDRLLGAARGLFKAVVEQGSDQILGDAILAHPTKGSMGASAVGSTDIKRSRSPRER